MISYTVVRVSVPIGGGLSQGRVSSLATFTTEQASVLVLFWRMWRLMVSQPKHLSDLKKIEADVRITCRRCGFEDDWTPEALSKHLFEIGGSSVWSEITRYLSCRRFGCGSRELRALPVPYAPRPANVTRRVGKLDAQLLGTAMTILERAVAHARGQSVATLEVRLALLVVHRYARDREAIRRFWALASKPSRNVSEDLTGPFASSANGLNSWVGSRPLSCWSAHQSGRGKVSCLLAGRRQLGEIGPVSPSIRKPVSGRRLSLALTSGY